MNILLLSMPDSFEHTSVITMRMPNGALGSLAGNLDPHHNVSIGDLILAHGRIRATVERLVRTLEPDVVGLSIMTFQRRTAQRIATLVRRLRPEATIVVGGYDPSLAPRSTRIPRGSDVIVREGDITFTRGDSRPESGAALGYSGSVAREGDTFAERHPPGQLADRRGRTRRTARFVCSAGIR
jgi:hypothetical protein